jgi:hypothetical protein
MESISQLVSDSLARHGMEPSLDHLRIEWSRWFRCESSFSVLLVPAKPGIFALGEEMVPAGELELRASSPVEGKRMLALFQVSDADDLGMALGRLFLPGNPLLRKLNSGRCFARYAVIEDAAQRSAAYSTFQRWMQDSAETASGISAARSACTADPADRLKDHDPCGTDTPVRAETKKDVKSDSEVIQVVPPSTSSAWGVGFMEVQNREAREVVSRPTPLPSGF